MKTRRAALRGAGRPLSAVVAENIRAEAARRGLTGRDLGEIVGLGQMAISDRSRGRTPWGVDELGLLAEAFAVPVAALVADHSTRAARAI